MPGSLAHDLGKTIVTLIAFVVAAVLNVLMLPLTDFTCTGNIRRYGFLFGAPWAWRLDHGWFGFCS